MAKKSVHLPRRIVCQQILNRFSLADCGNDRRSQIGLACGIASALAAEWVEPDRRRAAGEPAFAANRVSDARIRGKLRHGPSKDTNQSSNDAALAEKCAGHVADGDQRRRFVSLRGEARRASRSRPTRSNTHFDPHHDGVPHALPRLHGFRKRVAAGRFHRSIEISIRRQQAAARNGTCAQRRVSKSVSEITSAECGRVIGSALLPMPRPFSESDGQPKANPPRERFRRAEPPSAC